MQNVDLAAVRKLLSGLAPQEIAMIMTAFEADVIRLVREMASASAAEDQHGYRRAAHALAGTAGNFGARHLEALTRRSSDMSCSEPMGAIRAVAQTTISELKQLLGAVPAPY
jgi:HPt (histidine-containing phosphotransfer) domain-containing protein